MAGGPNDVSNQAARSASAANVPAVNQDVVHQDANAQAADRQVQPANNRGDIGLLSDHQGAGQVRLSENRPHLMPASIAAGGNDRSAAIVDLVEGDLNYQADLRSLSFEKSPGPSEASGGLATPQGPPQRNCIYRAFAYLGNGFGRMCRSMNDAHLKWLGGGGKLATVWAHSGIGTALVKAAVLARKDKFTTPTPDKPHNGHFYQEPQYRGATCAVHACNAWAGGPGAYTADDMTAAYQQNRQALAATGFPLGRMHNEGALMNGFSAQTVQKAMFNEARAKGKSQITDYASARLQDRPGYKGEDGFKKLRDLLIDKIDRDGVDRIAMNISGNGNMTDGHWVTFRRDQRPDGTPRWVLLDSKATLRNEVLGHQPEVDPIAYIQQQRQNGAHTCEIITPHSTRRARQDVNGAYARELLGPEALGAKQFVATLPGDNAKERRHMKDTLTEVALRLDGQGRSHLSDDKLLENLYMLVRRMESQFPIYSFNDINRVRDLAIAYDTCMRARAAMPPAHDQQQQRNMVQEEPENTPPAYGLGVKPDAGQVQEIEIEYDRDELLALFERRDGSQIEDSDAQSESNSVEPFQPHVPPLEDENAEDARAISPERKDVARQGGKAAGPVQARAAKPVRPPVIQAPKPVSVDDIKRVSADDMAADFMEQAADIDFAPRGFLERFLDVVSQGPEDGRMEALKDEAEGVKVRALARLGKSDDKGDDFTLMLIAELAEKMVAKAALGQAED